MLQNHRLPFNVPWIFQLELYRECLWNIINIQMFAKSCCSLHRNEWKNVDSILSLIEVKFCANFDPPYFYFIQVPEYGQYCAVYVRVTNFVSALPNNGYQDKEMEWTQRQRGSVNFGWRWIGVTQWFAFIRYRYIWHLNFIDRLRIKLMSIEIRTECVEYGPNKILFTQTMEVSDWKSIMFLKVTFRLRRRRNNLNLFQRIWKGFAHPEHAFIYLISDQNNGII